MINGINITKELDNHILTLHLAGRIDTVTAPELETAITESIDSITKLILDFANVEYISSAGLRVLLSAQKVMVKKDGMELCMVNQAVSEVFEVTGFSDILTII